MTPTQRKKELVSILITQLRDEYDAYVHIEQNFMGEFTAIGLAVPFSERERALPLFNILKMYIAPSYRKRRRRKNK